MEQIDFEKEGLLEGLEVDERESRRKLLEELVDDGFELDYLREEDEDAYTQADVDAAKSVREMLETGVPEEGILELARAMSQSMASLAATVGRVFGDAFMHEGDNELDLARRYTQVAKEVAPHVPPILSHVFAIQQREELRRAMVDLEAVSRGELAGSEDI